MRLASILLLVTMLFIPFQAASADRDAQQNVVTLTGDQINSADEIEVAIGSVTAQGTRPGTVILDGRNGPFLFTEDDRSLNIFVSNLTLRGVNHAMVQNCDDGLFFDDFQGKHILVEGVDFFCTGDGVDVIGEFQDVTLRNNTFQAGLSGITIGAASSDWLITENTILGRYYGIWAAGVNQMVIGKNYISGDIGINLQGCSQFQLRNNAIQALHQGVLLTKESQHNKVQSNTILGVDQSGIGLEDGVIENWILANRVFCAPGAECLTVDASPEAFEMNRIAGNKP